MVNGSGLVRPRRLAQWVPEIAARDPGWIHSFPPDALDPLTTFVGLFSTMVSLILVPSLSFILQDLGDA